jgi:sugar lactone lactonase YvrE
MRKKLYPLFLVLIVLTFGSEGWSAKGAQFPKGSDFSTLIITPLAIEGLTGDATGNLYTTGRAAAPTQCPVWRINLSSPGLVVVGFLPNLAASPCNPSGIAFDRAGALYVADAASGGIIWTLVPDANSPPTATPFAMGVPGTNGLAFDRNGNLWTGDGTTGQGRVWKISGSGANCAPASLVNCAEVFRIQPMRNGTGLGGEVAGDGVGRQARTYPPGTNSTTVANPVVAPLPAGVTLNAAGDQVTFTPQGGQDLVANGLAFNRQGTLFVVDTARGAIWKIEFDSKGNLRSPTGCDTTFTENTLCLSNILVAHPLLEGADGFVLDQSGSFWVDANERNAIIVFAKNGEIIEVFRNLPDGSGLRNGGPLEFPTSPFISGKVFCTSNSDGNRRDNSPNSAGEINSGGAVGARGKISCMDEELKIPGMLLPVNN